MADRVDPTPAWEREVNNKWFCCSGRYGNPASSLSRASPELQEALVINKQPKLSDKWWLPHIRTDTHLDLALAISNGSLSSWQACIYLVCAEVNSSAVRGPFSLHRLCINLFTGALYSALRKVRHIHAYLLALHQGQ